MKNILCAALSYLVIAAGPAAALTIDLIWEFDGNADGSTIFGTVDIVEDSGDLNFEITADTSQLGASADIQEFYFNMVNEPTNFQLTTDNHPANGSMYLLEEDPSVAGSAGAMFDYGVSFGNGGGPSGNGTLQFATFTLSADQTLSISDLLKESTANNIVPVLMAVHFQETIIFGATSETIGGGTPDPVPEPTTLLLFGVGLAAFAGIGRARSDTAGTDSH